MNTDKKVVYGTIKFALRGSALYNVNVAGTNQITTNHPYKNSAVKASTKQKKNLKVLETNLCESVDNMKLRSDTRKRKSIDENDINPSRKVVTKIRKTVSLEASRASQRKCKKLRASDESKELSIIASDCSSQLSLNKPKFSDKLKEPVGFKHSKEIEKRLNESRLNLKEMFCIKSNTRCVKNFQLCQTVHSNKIEICDYYAKNSTKMLLAETRVLNFLKALDGMIFRDVFPGVELIIELIGTILTYDKIDKSASNECIIAGSLNTFHRIMFKFPPCLANINVEYHNLIKESCYKSDTISLPNFEFQNGIFWKLIEMLETLIENDVENDDVLNLSQQSEDGFDFYTWEKRQITQYYRHNIPRDDKIDRIFYILHFLIDLMECEFVNWIQRYLLDNKIDEKAIITGLLWPNDVPGTITMNVKRIITLFTKFVAVNLPDNKIKILSSLVTLIGNVMLHETMKNDYNKYPNRNFNCIEELSKEIFKIVTDVQSSTEYTKVKLAGLIVRHLELPSLKMLLGNALIDKIENLYSRQLNLEKLYKILINDSWKIVAPKSPKKNKTGYIVQNEPSDSLYPFYIKNWNKSRKSCESINYEEYIIVLFETFKAYLNYFKLDTILHDLNDPFETKSSSPSSYRIKSPKKEIEKANFATTTKVINFKLVEKNLKKSVEFFNPNEKLNKSFGASCYNDKVSENFKIDNVVLKQYHADIEYFHEIENYLEIQKENNIYFKIFKEFIKDCIND